MDKNSLDTILERHKAQPVGNGYIDIIISRDNYKEFVKELVNNGFKIESVSWWEWCEANKECEYGLGGPESLYYNGWFAEIPTSVDDTNFSKDDTNESKISQVLKIIESRKIVFSDETVTFESNTWMTPAIWLDVPGDWKNKYNT